MSNAVPSRIAAEPPLSWARDLIAARLPFGSRWSGSWALMAPFALPLEHRRCRSSSGSRSDRHLFRRVLVVARVPRVRPQARSSPRDSDPGVALRRPGFHCPIHLRRLARDVRVARWPRRHRDRPYCTLGNAGAPAPAGIRGEQLVRRLELFGIWTCSTLLARERRVRSSQWVRPTKLQPPMAQLPLVLVPAFSSRS